MSAADLAGRPLAFASNPVGAAAPLHRSGPPKAAVVFGCTAGARGLTPRVHLRFCVVQWRAWPLTAMRAAGLRVLARPRAAMSPAALVGIAGSFIGFHISVILGLLPSLLMHYILAALGALIVLWLWRGR